MNVKLEDLKKIQDKIDNLKQEEMKAKIIIQQLETQIQPVRAKIVEEIEQIKDTDLLLYQLTTSFLDESSNDNITKLYSHIKDKIEKSGEK